MAENKYIFFRNDQRQEYFEFDPQNPDCLDGAGYKYFGRVLNLLAPRIEGRGLVIYVTAWTVHELPSYGPNVISCILQDEWGRAPHYRDKVGMVFKTCGKSPVVPEAFGYGGWVDTITNVLAQAKSASRDGKGRLKTALATMAGKRIAPVHEIPLGYFAREDIDFIPIEDRPNDLYFAGSMQHLVGKGAKLKRPKELARRRMENALKDLAAKEPDVNILSSVTGSFGESIKTDNASYLLNMMNTKICPIPRGANLETFRFYEAIRYGCIPVGEALPRAWYYDDAPVIRLKDWSELGERVMPVLKDADRLKDMHRAVLDWWKCRCSEGALVEFIRTKLKDGFEGEVSK